MHVSSKICTSNPIMFFYFNSGDLNITYTEYVHFTKVQAFQLMLILNWLVPMGDKLKDFSDGACTTDSDTVFQTATAKMNVGIIY